MELRDETVSKLLDCFMDLGWSINDGDPEMIADRVLDLPEIREALSLKHNLETALRVNGSFHVTAETIKASGNSWANPSSSE